MGCVSLKNIRNSEKPAIPALILAALQVFADTTEKIG